jgi:hypothetical protein
MPLSLLHGGGRTNKRILLGAVPPKRKVHDGKNGFLGERGKQYATAWRTPTIATPPRRERGGRERSGQANYLSKAEKKTCFCYGSIYQFEIQTLEAQQKFSIIKRVRMPI